MVEPTTLHELTFPNLDSVEYTTARYHYLLQILYGETLAIEYCKQIAGFAPNETARLFLMMQQEEENAHLELLTDYIISHPRPQSTVSNYFSKVHSMMSSAIEKKDYAVCIFIQNFVVEGLVVSLLREFEHHADPTLGEVSAKIITDEKKHVAFGVSEIKRLLREDMTGKLQRNFRAVQRKTFFYGAALAVSLIAESNRLGIPMREFSRNVVQDHLTRIQDAGLKLNSLDKLFFFLVKNVIRIL